MSRNMKRHKTQVRLPEFSMTALLTYVPLASSLHPFDWGKLITATCPLGKILMCCASSEGNSSHMQTSVRAVRLHIEQWSQLPQKLKSMNASGCALMSSTPAPLPSPGCAVKVSHVSRLAFHPKMV